MSALKAKLQSGLLKVMLKLPASIKVKMAGGKPLTIEGRTLDPNFQFLAHGAASQPPMSSFPAEVGRAASAAGLAMLADKPAPGVSWSDFTIPGKQHHNIPVRLYRPENQDPKAPMMVYFHFGGGVIGDLETCHVFCTMLACVVRCPVLSVDYRLAPEHKHPAGLDDCLSAYEWALKHAGEHGAPSGRATIGGDSMGGYFSALVCQRMKEEDKPLPDLQLLIYPATDLDTVYPSASTFGEAYPLSTDTMNWFIEQLLPTGTNRADPHVSPGLARELDGQPPAIVVTAGFDPLVDEGADYARKLEEADVEVVYKCYDSLAHGFTAFTGPVPAARDACYEIAGMVRDAYDRF